MATSKKRGSKSNDWGKYPRTKDKVILVGMHPNTRDKTPWQDESAEIWILNEMYHYPAIKRWDRTFQIHAKWDFSRTNNLNDPNHYLWLQNKSGTCLFCKGESKVQIDGKVVTCPECKEGQYTPPADRSGRIIYMQEAFPEIPGAVAFPLDYLTKKYCADGVPYFTSTFSMMLIMAIELGFPHIELYGFEMGSDTEYHYQRVCGEYWVGYGRGRGIKIEAPGANILKGELYGFNNMRLGFRQQLEMRKGNLKQQMVTAHAETKIAEGMVRALEPFQAMPEVKADWAAATDYLYKTKMFWNFLNGTQTEVENMMGLHDTYFVQDLQNADGSAKPYEDATSHIGLKYSFSK